MEILPKAHGRSTEQNQPPENLRKKAMENDREEEFGPQSDSTSFPLMRDPSLLRLPLFYNSRRETV